MQSSRQVSVQDSTPEAPPLRHDWTREEIRRMYELPLPELIFQAQIAHRQFHASDEVQLCRLLSIKTGGCPEDCAYCPQSAHYETGVFRQALLDPGDVFRKQPRAPRRTAPHDSAWEPPGVRRSQGKEFESVLDMVRAVAALDLEVCCTLGMLTSEQAQQLKQAGLTAYNHNLDTSPEFYSDIITTRIYEDRLQTISHVRKAGITVCCGGILGMGESAEDRIGLLQQLSNLNPHPESVPVNTLVRAEGTPLQNAPDLDYACHGSHNRVRSNPHARSPGKARRRPPRDVAGSGDPLLSSRR